MRTQEDHQQGFDILKRRAYGHDAGINTTVIGNPVADDGTGNRISMMNQT